MEDILQKDLENADSKEAVEIVKNKADRYGLEKIVASAEAKLATLTEQAVKTGGDAGKVEEITAGVYDEIKKVEAETAARVQEVTGETQPVVDATTQEPHESSSKPELGEEERAELLKRKKELNQLVIASRRKEDELRQKVYNSPLYDKASKLGDQLEVKITALLGNPEIENAWEDRWDKIQFKGKEIFDKIRSEVEQTPGYNERTFSEAIQNMQVPLMLRFGTLGKLKDLLTKDPTTQELIKTQEEIDRTQNELKAQLSAMQKEASEGVEKEYSEVLARLG